MKSSSTLGSSFRKKNCSKIFSPNQKKSIIFKFNNKEKVEHYKDGETEEEEEEEGTEEESEEDVEKEEEESAAAAEEEEEKEEYDDEEEEEEEKEHQPPLKKKRLRGEEKEISNTLKENDKRLMKTANPSVHCSFAQKYMWKLGHKEGRGLGKNQDGIVEPVEASKQIGKRGLGYKSINLESVLSKFDPTMESITINEEVHWLSNNYSEIITKATLDSWIKIGSPERTFKNHYSFCDSDTIKNIMASKSVLNSFGTRDIVNGRMRANPFESISKTIFLNRAAMKMANLDALLNWMFTQPKDLNGGNIIDQQSLLYFADVCAGPGGFSEYVFFRKKWRAKGFGFTLRNHNDFTLNEFWAGPSETFEPHYGVKGDGDIYEPENIMSFRDHVLLHTDGKGVHFMMADGGVQIDENFNDQEFICKKLYLCQCLVALLIVRINGHFVVKLFDLFSTFSVGLIYLMFRSFREISIIKPNTSRPANSERYLVCKFKREDCEFITKHLFEVNKRVPRYEEKAELDVLEIVPMSVLTRDSQFFNYIYLSNTRIGKNQIVSLNKLAAFCEDANLKEERQQELRKKCLEKWQIPDEARVEPKKYDAVTKCMELMGSSSLREFELTPKPVESFDYFKARISSLYDWRFVIINGKMDKNSCAFYLGLGRNNVSEYTSKGWRKLSSDITGFYLPSSTLVYGEIVEEIVGEGRGQTKSYAFHIVDGLFLGGEDIRSHPLQVRRKWCELFAKALYKKSFPFRVKKQYKLLNFNLVMNNLVYKLNKSSSSKSLYYTLESNLAFKVNGILFLKDTKGCWNRYFSSRWGTTYFYKKETSIFETHVKDDQKADIYATFADTFRERMIWWGDFDSTDSQVTNKMRISHLSNFITDCLSIAKKERQ